MCKSTSLNTLKITRMSGFCVVKKAVSYTHLDVYKRQGYNKVQEAERAGCWAHMRRKWLEAMPEGADAKTCKAAERCV